LLSYVCSTQAETARLRHLDLRLLTHRGGDADLRGLFSPENPPMRSDGKWGLPPGVMIPPHTHSREHERNYVSKGELTCDVGGEIAVAQAGSSVVRHR
jgi:quercetin dioxygenase-like cupin family protein